MLQKYNKLQFNNIKIAMESAPGYFYVDVNGRGYWSQNRKEELSGPEGGVSEEKAS